MKINIYKNRSAIIFGSFLFFLIFTPVVFAISANFIAKATEYYERNCRRNVDRIPRATAILCYLFDKVSELDQTVSDHDSRLSESEVTNASQSAKILELEQRISNLENNLPPYGTPYSTPSYSYPSPSYGTPSYSTPSYDTPSYGTPEYGTPLYGTPSYETPTYGTPSYSYPTPS